MTDHNPLPIPGAGAAELLPCPFCGAVPSIEGRPGIVSLERIVACEADECDVSPCVSGRSVAEACARWNRRAALRPAAGAAAVTTADPSARAGAGERVDHDAAWIAAACRALRPDLWSDDLSVAHKAASPYRIAYAREQHHAEVAAMRAAVATLDVGYSSYDGTYHGPTASASRSPAAGGVAAEGYVVVPVEPTDEMRWAGWRASGKGFDTTREVPSEGAPEQPAAVYRAMLAAAPKAEPAAARGSEEARVPAEESANPHTDTWADRELNHLEHRAMGALTAHVFDRLDDRQHDALCHARVRLDALERRLAYRELAGRATPDTARPSRAEGDGGQHG